MKPNLPKLIKEQKIRISQLEKLIPLTIHNVGATAPIHSSYTELKHRLDTYKSEYKTLTGRDYKVRERV